MENNNSKIKALSLNELLFVYCKEEKEVKRKEIENLIFKECKGYILGIIRGLNVYDKSLNEDLYFAGILGVLKGIGNYKFTFNVDFISYAYKGIKGEILKEFNRFNRGFFENHIIKNNFIIKNENDIASRHNINILYQLLEGKLSNIERIVLIYNYGLYDAEVLTLIEIGNIYNISKQRVCQIKKIGIRKLKIYKKLFYF